MHRLPVRVHRLPVRVHVPEPVGAKASTLRLHTHHMPRTVETLDVGQALKDAQDKAKLACYTLNKWLDDPMGSLMRYQSIGIVSVSSQGVESTRCVQKAFFTLSDQIKDDELRFRACVLMGSVWADFTDDDGTVWCAALLLDRAPSPPAKWEIVLTKK